MKASSKINAITERYLSDGYVATRANLSAIFEADKKATLQSARSLQARLITADAFKASFDFFFSEEETKRRAKEYKLDWSYYDFYKLFDKANLERNNGFAASIAQCQQMRKVAEVSEADREAYKQAINDAKKQGIAAACNVRALLKFKQNGNILEELKPKEKPVKVEKHKVISITLQVDKNWNPVTDLVVEGIPATKEGTPLQLAIEIFKKLANKQDITSLVQQFLPSKIKD